MRYRSLIYIDQAREGLNQILKKLTKKKLWKFQSKFDGCGPNLTESRHMLEINHFKLLLAYVIVSVVILR